MTANSSGQNWDPDHYQRVAGYVPVLGRPVLELLDPQPHEAVLDLGCGDGALTQELAALAGRVVAVDASAEQVAAARARGLDARVVRAEALAGEADFAAAFDAVFSNAALHWVPDAAAVATGIGRALKPGGRFVAEFGGAGNVGAVRTAVHQHMTARGFDPDALDPWYFPTTDAYAAVLEAAGLTVDSIELIDRPTPVPGGVGEWLGMFAGTFLSALPAADRGPFKRAVTRDLQATLTDANGQWFVDYVRLRVAAHA